MTNPYPANFETVEGTRRLTGQVNFTDPGNQPGGGVTPPVTLTGTDPNTTPLTINANPAQATDILDIFGSGSGFLELDQDCTLDLHGNSPTQARLLRVRGTSGNALEIDGDGAGGVGSITLSGADIDLEADSHLYLGSGSGTEVRGVGRIKAQQPLVLQSHSAPTDGSLAAGDCALWFDQTNGVGNGKLMVKAKQADGTVVTAAIVLA